MSKQSLPKLTGWYIPTDRSSDFTGELVHPVTGELYRPPSMTKQSFVAECDINNIIKQYRVSGVVSHISARAREGMYIDLPDQIDFQQSLEVITRAQQAFDSLPSSVRSRFQNRPEEFLAFCSDPANAAEMIKLGLATAPAAPPPAAPAPQGPAPVPEPTKTG